MAKKNFIINKFDGGLNNNADPRDIADNELAEAQDCKVDQTGKILTMGQPAEHQSETAASGTHANEITSGFGLFAWNHDRVDGHTKSAASDDAETGENYLAFSDSDTTGNVSIYAFSDDTWGNPITGMTDNTGGTRQDNFYSVDGALRVCDGRFTNSNNSQWYGYIDRVLFQSISDTVTTNQWYQAAQAISAPDATSEFDQAVTANTVTAGTTYDSGDSDKNQDFEITEASLNSASVANMKGFLEVTVRITTASYGTEIPDFNSFDTTFTLKTGSANLNGNVFLGVEGTSHKTSIKNETADFGSGNTRDIVYTFSMGDNYFTTSNGQSFGSGSEFGIKTTLTNISFDSDFVTAVDIRRVRVQEASLSGNNISSLTDGNVHLQVAYGAPSSGEAIGWNKLWEYGVAFIYDEKQESLIRTLFDSSASDTTEQDNTNADHSPTVKFYVKARSSAFNRRITGAVWYAREASGGESANEWTAQIEYDFVKGVSRILQTGKEVDCIYNATDTQYEFEVANENLLSPNLVDTYQTRTSIFQNEKSIKAKYKTAVMVGRRMYIGNVQTIDEDNVKEIKADAMIKTPVNRFDTFPSQNIIEASINDGESIVKLEEFADRILQYKENTLYIINVSKNVEFLEDVYKYKGVKSASAVCKTDFGIAWVNQFGLFLYNGREVINLLEKKGQKIIKDDGSTTSWQTYMTNNPMIGYLPKKRQLLIVDDNDTTGTGQIFIYDLVTRSLVYGSAASIVSQKLTNFVNDVNGDLVWSHTSDTGTMQVWSDTSVAQSAFAIQTKDVDFNRLGVKKKIYTVYISYKGDGSALNVKYGVNGETDINDAFQFNNDNTPLEDKSSAENIESWHVAELKPTNSSEATNIYSFKLFFSGTAGATFAINDIAIVYKEGPIK